MNVGKYLSFALKGNLTCSQKYSISPISNTLIFFSLIYSFCFYYKNSRQQTHEHRIQTMKTFTNFVFELVVDKKCSFESIYSKNIFF